MPGAFGWRRGLGLAAIVGVAALVVFRTGPPRPPDAQVAARARAVLAPFKQQLMTALQEGLAQGPEAAIDVCRLRAPEIASSLATGAVRVGRTSHRLRNPANAPAPWMEPLLEELRRAEPGEIGYRVAPVGSGRMGYVEPIYVQPPCLTCHGESIAPSVAERIRTAYPQDRATGFALGEFRGLFWVELAAELAGT
ncbi:MAG: c-type heme family protein [Myxococcota bacterium]